MVCGCVASSQQASVDRTIATYSAISRTITARQSLKPPEWRIGQWATYKAYVNHAWTIQSLRIVAKDACGIWIETVNDNAAGEQSWLVCFRDDPTLSGADRLRTAIGDVDGKPTRYRFVHGVSAGVSTEMIAGFLDAVMLNTYPDDAPAEDISVIGGHFTQALRIDDGKDIRWIHPDVPFNGTIKRQRSGADERVLLGFGETLKRGEVGRLEWERIAAENQSRPSLFIGLEQEFGLLTGRTGGSSRGTSMASIAMGLRLTEQLDFLFESSFDVSDEVPALSFIVAGVRWHPFGRAGFTRAPGAAALYVQAAVGGAELSNSTTMHANDGIGLDAAIGWAAIEGHDFTISYELRDHFAALGDGDGTRNYISIGVAVDLYLDLLRNR